MSPAYPDANEPKLAGWRMVADSHAGTTSRATCSASGRGNIESPLLKSRNSATICQGWTKALSDHQCHKALANGWRLGVARQLSILGWFAARVSVRINQPQSHLHQIHQIHQQPAHTAREILFPAAVVKHPEYTKLRVGTDGAKAKEPL